MCDLTHLSHGIAYCARQSDHAHDGQIDNVITDIGNLLIGEPRLCLDVRIGGTLVEVSLIDKIDMQLSRTILNNG